MNTRTITIAHIKQHPLKTVLLLVSIILTVLLSLLPPQIIRIIIDDKLTKSVSTGLLALAMGYIGCTLLSALFDGIKNVLLISFGQEIVQDLRGKMELKLKHLPLSFYTTHSPGEVSSRFSNDAEQISTLFSSGVVNLMIDMSKVVGIIISIALFSGRLALLTFLVVPFLAVFTKTFRRAIFRAQKKNLDQIGKVNAHLSETLEGIHMVKAYARETYMENRYKDQLAENFKTLDNVNQFDAMYTPIINLLKGILIAVVVVLSSDKLDFLGITIGMVAASVDLVSDLFRPIDALGMELERIQKGRSGIVNVDAFLNQAEEEPKDETITMETLSQDGKYTIAFDHVGYRYPDGDKNVLTDLHFTVENGTHVAFAGRTGVGKTTLFRLVLGLVPPTEGRLTINGHDISKIPNSLKRKLFGSVEQQFTPVEGTLFDQVTLGDPAITREQVIHALQFVSLSELLPNLDKAFFADQYSQGEKQLLSIARAIVADPPILLFDEITASLDSKTEKQLNDVLKAASKERTLLAISHRRRTMLDNDLLVKIEEGRVVGIGKPEDMVV